MKPALSVFFPLLVLLTAGARLVSATPAEVRKAISDFGVTVDDMRKFSPMLGLPDEQKVLVSPGEKYLPPIKDARKLESGPAHTMAAVLLDRYSYTPDMAKACGGFHTDAILQLSKARDLLEVHFCFGCDEVAVMLNGKPLAYADIDRGSNELKRIFKTVFPDSERAKALQYFPCGYNTQLALDWAETVIPNNPLYLKLKKMRLEDVSDQDAEEVATRATLALQKQWKKETPSTEKP